MSKDKNPQAIDLIKIMKEVEAESADPNDTRTEIQKVRDEILEDLYTESMKRVKREQDAIRANYVPLDLPEGLTQGERRRAIVRHKRNQSIKDKPGQ